MSSVKSSLPSLLDPPPRFAGQLGGNALQPVEKQVEGRTRFSGDAKIDKPREVDFEIEYSERLFAIEPGLLLRTHNPLRLGYRNEDDVLEVLGWGIELPLGEGASLSQRISRRFLELFSHSQEGTLSDLEASMFAQICAQVDYRAFCADRRGPRWREAWLVRKAPVWQLDFGTGDNVKLAPTPARSLQVLNAGDYFGAWFTMDRDGEITAIKNVELRANPTSTQITDWPEPKPVEFDPELKPMLPEPDMWKEE